MNPPTTAVTSTLPLLGNDRLSRTPAWRVEDWWAAWIGIGVLVTALLAYRLGSPLGWLAVSPPAKWDSVGSLVRHFVAAAPRYLALFLALAAVFGAAVAALGLPSRPFLRAFPLLFVAAAAVYTVGQWQSATRYNLEPPLVALAVGLLVANTVGVPAWLRPALRAELFIKTGIVLLGASVPLALLAWAGPVAILQAGIVSLVTFGTIYFVGTRLGLDRRLAATLGAGGAVCGVSAAIAVSGAVGAKREHAPIAITLVILWALVLVFLLPLVARSLGLPAGVAGAWIGTSEFADAAGLAAAQTYGGYTGPGSVIAGTPESAIRAFTLMKVIGRDVWIGIWAVVLSFVAITRWDRTGIAGGSAGREVWQRFPKFVLGFLAASVIVTLAARGLPYADYKKLIVPNVVQPLQVLRTWAFLLAFTSIGLNTRLADLVSARGRPFVAFTAGVVVNLVLGYVLSTTVFGSFWAGLGE